MYLDTASVTSAKGRRYSRVLLRSSYREAGKVKHRTLGNLSRCSTAAGLLLDGQGQPARDRKHTARHRGRCQEVSRRAVAFATARPRSGPAIPRNGSPTGPAQNRKRQGQVWRITPCSRPPARLRVGPRHLAPIRRIAQFQRAVWLRTQHAPGLTSRAPRWIWR